MKEKGGREIREDKNVGVVGRGERYRKRAYRGCKLGIVRWFI